MKKSIVLSLSLLLSLAVASHAGFLDKLGKDLLQGAQQQPATGNQQQQQQPAKNSKQEKTGLIISGITDVLSGTSEVPYKTERTTGESLSLEGFKRYGLPKKNEDLQRYVNLVGSAVARNSTRPNIPYNFVVVESPLYNAFAAPGGIIFVTSTLVKNMKDEAELAAVLAHEVGHVAYKHALNTIQRGQLLGGLGKLTAASMKGEQGKQLQEIVGGLQTILFDKGLDKELEFEADSAAIDIAYRTGYDPAGLSRVLTMLTEKQKGAEHKGTWFSTHPPLDERLKKINAKVAKLKDVQTLARLPERFALNTK